MNKQAFAEIGVGLAAGNLAIINAAFALAHPTLGEIDVGKLDDAMRVLHETFPKAELGSTEIGPFMVVIGSSTSELNDSFGLAFADAFVKEVKATALDKFFSESGKAKGEASKTNKGQGAGPGDRSLGLKRY